MFLSNRLIFKALINSWKFDQKIVSISSFLSEETVKLKRMNKLLWFLAVLNVSCAYSVSKLVGNETSPSMPECDPAKVEW